MKPFWIASTIKKRLKIAAKIHPAAVAAIAPNTNALRPSVFSTAS